MGGVCERPRCSYELANMNSSLASMGGVNCAWATGLADAMVAVVACDFWDDFDDRRLLTLLLEGDLSVVLLRLTELPWLCFSDSASSEEPARRSRSSRRLFNFLPITASLC